MPIRDRIERNTHWFAYSPDRQGKHPVQHLRPFRSILQADAFSGVNAKIIGRFGDADDFLDCFIIPVRIVGGTFWG